MASFERKTGAQRDLAELCYVSALHQTASDVRKDGSIRDDLSNDELHLLGGGYIIWRDAIADLLAREL